MLMRFFQLCSLLLVTCLAPAAHAQQESGEARPAPAFFLKLNDVPLMPGLVELENEAIIFDKPGGRIAESSAESQTLSVEDINRFYTKTLPHLGWQQVEGNAFVRNDEMLEIDITDETVARHVQITVTPKP